MEQGNRGGESQQQNRQQPHRQVFEKPWQRNFFEPVQIIARLGLQAMKLAKQLILIRGKIRLRPLTLQGEQPAEFAVTAKGAAGRFFQKHKGFPAFGQLDFEIFQGCGGICQFGVPFVFRSHCARLKPVLLASFPVGSLHDLPVAREVGLGDAGFALFKPGPAIFLFRFQADFRVGDAFGQPRRLLLGCRFKRLRFRGGPGMELAVQLLLPRGKIMEGAFQRVQQREHFVDAQVTHNLCSSKAKRKPSGARACL